jgi:aminopeptidase
MLSRDDLERYADVLVWALKTAKKKPLKKKDIIQIQYDHEALPLAEVLFARLIDLGLHPIQKMSMTSNMEKSFFSKADAAQLSFIAPGEKQFFSNLNGRIYLCAPDSLTHLKGTDPGKISRAIVARKPIKDLLNEREEKGFYSWTLCVMPTQELARQAKMSLKKYAEQVVKGCFLDRKDPVAQWKDVYRRIHEIKQWLTSLPVKNLHIESANVDLRITPGEKRQWAGVSGHNMPSFEVFISPDWRGTEGVYFANLPSFRSGNYVENIRVEFVKGIAVKITADRGEPFLRKQLAMDPGARRVGEFSLTDKRFSRIDRFMAETLFDENFGGDQGNCHLAFGSSYSDTFKGDPARLTDAVKKQLGFNDSALHWDIINTERKTVTAHLRDGKRKVIYDNGVFTE